MLRKHERQRLLQARSLGPTVINWLAEVDYETPENTSFRVEIATGIKPNAMLKRPMQI